MTIIDDILNKTTMYRLVLYYLIALLLTAFFLCLAGVLPYSPWALLASTTIILGICLLANAIFARTFNATPNIESAYITALILALIITPQLTFPTVMLMVWAAILAMASKYILSYRHKHLFNPVAISVVITALFISQSASWWVGTISMLPIVVIGGLLVIRKIKRASLVWAFIITATIVIITTGLAHGSSIIENLRAIYLYSPLLFFAFLMLTEPLTSPPTKKLQIWYGVIVGLLFAPRIHLGSVYSTPELALVVGNVFAFIVSSKGRVTLTLKEIRRVANDTYDFVFRPSFPVKFLPGQFLELTLVTAPSDARGNRRFFTIASAPTEKEIRFGVKFYPKSSRFKQVLAELKPNQSITAAQTAGSFTLPRDPAKKLAFIAGGIGVTPFRSQVKYLLDSGQKRDIILLYSNKTVGEIAYADLFAAAEPLGLKTVYTLTDRTTIPANWPGQTGLIDQKMLTTQAPDYQDRLFYLSGPHAMVVAFEKLLSSLGVPKSQIKTDYFPGYA